MQKTHKGSCHCGRVTFELRAELGAIIECNCSLCSRKGALWHGTDDAHFEILTGEDDLVLYQFGTHDCEALLMPSLRRQHFQSSSYCANRMGCQCSLLGRSRHFVTHDSRIRRTELGTIRTTLYAEP